jgi:radical SAM protein with 4Fe4S-binding SPASM domain
MSDNQFITKKKEEYALAVNPDNSRWVLLGGVATDILGLLSEGCTEDSIVTTLLHKYETTEDTLRRDVKWVEEKLRLRGVLGKTRMKYNSTYPSNLLIEVTPRCNLTCAYCYVENSPDDVPLTFEEQKSTVDQFADVGGKYLAFSGGEPLLCDFLFDIIEYASHYNFENMKLITNGTLWTEKEVSRTGDLNLSVTISLDSLTKDVHETLRGKGHERVMRTIEMMLDYGIGKNITISTTPTKLNLTEIPIIMDYCIENEIGAFECPFFVRRGRGKSEGCNLAPDTTQTNDLIHTLWDYYLKFRKKLEIESYYISCLKILAANKGGAHRCPVGESVKVSPSGDLYPCVFGSDFCLGNIKNQPLAHILDTSSVLNELKAFDIDCVEECTECVWKYVCSGGCRAASYDTYGTIDCKSMSCSLHKDMFWEILWGLPP